MKPNLTTVDLPLHPSLRHPLTGEPLRAVYRDRHGRLRWPVIGAEDDPPKDPSKPDDPPKDDPPKPDPPKDKDEPDDKDLGFPRNTPVAEMSDKQAAAYWKHYARRHEDDAKKAREALGDPEQAEKDRKELEEFRRSKMTEHEKAVEDAKKKGEKSAEEKFSQQLVRAELRGRLAQFEDVDVADGVDKRDRIIDGLNLQQFVTDEGDVNTAKVKKYVSELIGPAKGGSNGRTDYGAGRRDSGSGSGVDAGADAYRRRHPKKSEKVA